ncbi:MAG: hypothetical protein RJA10_3057, partial [Pseudomonadota bacterium]
MTVSSTSLTAIAAATLALAAALPAQAAGNLLL